MPDTVTKGYDAKTPLRLLLVEDSPSDQRLIEEILRSTAIVSEAVDSLANARARLIQGHVDLVLLDLGLPDSQGLDGLSQLLAETTDIPIVVMTGLSDDALGFEALRIGAEDFLQKDWITDAALIQRSLRFAVERHRLRVRVQIAEREQETLALGRIGGSAKVSISASAFGFKPLRESDPDLFTEIRDTYGQILSAAAEQQVYQVEHPVSERLRKLADQLGFVRASPRDLIDLHSAAIQGLTKSVSAAQERLLVNEGRIRILELMGYLVSYYRRYYVGSMGIQTRGSQ
ncbi:MAG: response regulator [Lamprobacter sp.]|uniref:response regulator n=1 Tax=Lamprobacter sp. TaxID=3100796 RepID=UPI002B25FA5D|nr:response regulator [Lamprobacter sp.]MEA3641423.1 response regulator [Lamprobacter sp.]